MAQATMHRRNDSGVSVHSFIVHENPPSPTLTNPDMIVPIPPWQNDPSVEDQGPHPLLEPEIPLSRPISNTSTSTPRHSAEELGIATAVLMPTRVTAPPPTSIHGATTPVASYSGYEHGAPLSDIYEESEATATPKSSHTIRNERSPSPTPIPKEWNEIPSRPALRHKKRISSLSTSSSGGSDVGDWENFDSSKVLSDRVAADLAQMRREDTLEVEAQDVASKRQSREEEELAVLNARAEKILAHARRRLTHMEDNLKTARNSILLPSRSPNMGGELQPVGGLYRSISAAGATKLGKNKQHAIIRTSSSLQHMRGNSETGIPSSNLSYSRSPDTRSASAMEYATSQRYSIFPETTQNQSPAAKVQPSPTSTRSYNSPLRPLEEEADSPSTAETTPENAKAAHTHMRGLGILSAAAVSKENIAAHNDLPASRQTPTPSQLVRSTSSASARSAKELKDQMIDLRSRIADLKSKTQADNLKRRSSQSRRSSSPFTNATPEQWYASSPSYKENGDPINAQAGVGSRSALSPPPHNEQNYRAYSDEKVPSANLLTPVNARFLDVDRMTPDTEARMLSSARTDRNTPSLVRTRSKREQDGDTVQDSPEIDKSSDLQPSQYDLRSDEPHDDSDEDDEQIAENEEEQVYLNEVLEESLRDAEVEPEVPAIPGGFIDDGVGMRSFIGPEAERHEDRLDAFDYENMFLHSAMGTYTGKSLNGSDSGTDDESDDTASVETSRADIRTPVYGVDSPDELDAEQTTDEEMEDVMSGGKSPGLDIQSVRREKQPGPGAKQMPKSPGIGLPGPRKPWVHSRSKSMDSVSTSATFETATEGEHDDESPNEIVNWDPMPSSSLGYSPNSRNPYRTNIESPVRAKHGFSSPQGGGRMTPLATQSQNINSPLRQQYSNLYEPIYKQNKALGSPGLGLGVVGAENAQFINDNGVPERFQGQPSPSHSRESSTTSQQYGKFRSESQMTIIAAPGSMNHRRQQSSISSYTLSRSPLTPTLQNGLKTGSPSVVTISSSPQRKVVVNRALQRPESHILEPQMSSPPDLPLPAPPASSAALQAQMASPKNINVKRPTSAQKRQVPPTPQQMNRSQLHTPPILRDTAIATPTATSTPTVRPDPNTEILMESLIKLADPSFSLAPGIRFDDTDKGLVLGLLSAVGGVCNGVLRASVQSGSPALGKTQADEMVRGLRTRLDNATQVLEGRDTRATLTEGGLRMKEI